VFHFALGTLRVSSKSDITQTFNVARYARDAFEEYVIRVKTKLFWLVARDIVAPKIF
jgi:hypothetical protein